eukprot:CAMPEP_0177606340 /NCGR_PEP_ID=MMETSP0419_2-20121207/17249_1 /TAXON_ID=582737 /ORGANISM="Tetraselmis sp., Strain GSL018" /LENGTH=264 /DNA_ID=CAMNT_0019100683 /DNA_START=340 /DNA_END=1131 /DNA_ORIENTATION=-
MKANEGQQLSQILSSVLPVTEILRSTGHGSCEGSASYLALAVHCVLINEGFEVHTETSHASEYLSLKENLYTLPSDWKPTSRPCETEGYEGQWIFRYRYGTELYVVSCSIHLSGKLFIHAFQVGNPDNLQVLGLNPKRYVFDSGIGAVYSWDDVLFNLELLYDMCMEYICRPLLALSESPKLSSVRTEHFKTALPAVIARESSTKLTKQEGRAPLSPEPVESVDQGLRIVNSEFEILVRTPASILIPALLATTAVASTAVLWAW